MAVEMSNMFDINSPCFFVSPHLDDALFSAGDLIFHLAKKVPVTVITVFTKATSGPYTLSAYSFLKQSGYKNVRTLYENRNKEDEKLLQDMGVRSVHLGYVDALFRQKITKLNLLGKLVPELVHVYPTYRFHMAKGTISAYERDTLIEDLGKRLKKHIKNKSIVFAPAGIGNHVDHLITRDVCNKFFSPCIYWEDYPYNTRCPEQVDHNEWIVSHNLQRQELKTGWKEKVKLIKGYETQVDAIFPEGTIPHVNEAFYLGINTLADLKK
jgi:LmbE family N-acetylglucosaminyl deacetylase